MQGAHIVSRAYRATRWDLDNGLCLCREHHIFFTFHPVEFEEFLVGYIGEEYLARLKQRAKNYRRWKAESREDKLKELRYHLEEVIKLKKPPVWATYRMAGEKKRSHLA